MVRPKCCRKISVLPNVNYFKPKGIPLHALEEVVMTLDEFEAIRLADFEGLYQEDSANKMNVSRQTFARILDSAHKKIAEVLIKGKSLKIEGGDVEIFNNKNLICEKCKCTLKKLNNISSCPDCDKKIKENL